MKMQKLPVILIFFTATLTLIQAEDLDSIIRDIYGPDADKINAQANGNTDQQETNTDQQETNTDQQETYTEQQETNTEKQETNADQQETNTDQQETNTDQQETNTQLQGMNAEQDPNIHFPEDSNTEQGANAEQSDTNGDGEADGNTKGWNRRKRQALTGSPCTYWGRPGVCTRYYEQGYKCRRGEHDDPEKRSKDTLCASLFDACCSEDELQRIAAEERTSTTLNYDEYTSLK